MAYYIKYVEWHIISSTPNGILYQVRRMAYYIKYAEWYIISSTSNGLYICPRDNLFFNEWGFHHRRAQVQAFERTTRSTAIGLPVFSSGPSTQLVWSQCSTNRNTILVTKTGLPILLGWWCHLGASFAPAVSVLEIAIRDVFCSNHLIIGMFDTSSAFQELCWPL